MDRKDDLQSLFNSFSHLTQSLMKSNNASGGKKPINLGIEAEAMLQGKSFFQRVTRLGTIFILRKGVLRLFEPPTHLRKDIFTT